MANLSGLLLLLLVICEIGGVPVNVQIHDYVYTVLRVEKKCFRGFIHSTIIYETLRTQAWNITSAPER